MNSSSVLYQDEYICIVRPNTPGSIPIFTEIGYTIKTTRDICVEGLKSYNKRRETEPDLPERYDNRYEMDPTHNDTIFFRAPYSNLEEVDSNFDRKSLDEKVKSLYIGRNRQDILNSSFNKPTSIVTIDVDPTKTYVFNSDTRCIPSTDLISSCRDNFQKSKKLLSEFLKDTRSDYEILAKILHIPAEWFSSCLKVITREPVGEKPNEKEYYKFAYERDGLKQKLGRLRKISKEERDQLYKDSYSALTSKMKPYEEWKMKVKKEIVDVISKEYNTHAVGSKRTLRHYKRRTKRVRKYMKS